MYKPNSLQLLQKVRIGTPIISTACSRNFSTVLAGAVDKCVYCYDSELNLQWKMALDHEVWAVATSPNGIVMAAGTANKNPSEGKVYIFTSGGQIVFQVSLNSPIWDIVISETGRAVYVSTWNNRVSIIRLSDLGWEVDQLTTEGTCGNYGICENGTRGVLASISYDAGISLVHIDKKKLIGQIENKDAGYHIDYSPGTDSYYFGTARGQVVIQPSRKTKKAVTEKISQRPICAIKVSHSGSLVVAGGFDGRVSILDAELKLIESVATDGEIWDVDFSSDCGRVVAASGDGYLYVYDNSVTESAIQEASASISALRLASDWRALTAAIEAVLDFGAKLGCVEYAFSVVQKVAGQYGVGQQDISDRCAIMLQKVLSVDPLHARTNFMYAHYLFKKSEFWKSAQHYINAATDSELRQLAFNLAADCYTNVDCLPAAISCFRRSREQSLGRDDVRVIYNLARSLEDQGRFSEARAYFGILLAWNPLYRDVLSRAMELSSGGSGTGKRMDRDYTGLTVSLLGPDAPRFNEVAKELRGVLTSRAKELHITAEQRFKYDHALERFYGAGDGIRDITKTELGYDVQAYIKYDFLLPEDEIKKELERLNVLSALADKEDMKRSLDVGAATARWPRTFHSLGVEAHGIDVEPAAIEYSRRKIEAESDGSGFPKVEVGSGTNIQYPKDFFCVVTCMMGTFAHIDRGDHLKFLSECKRVLRPGGLLIISTWDIECPHQAYLSMYTLSEKQRIDRNSRKRVEFSQLGRSAGLQLIEQIPFCMIPDVVSLEIGAQEISKESLGQILSIELAARASFPEMHGEMFLSIFVA